MSKIKILYFGDGKWAKLCLKKLIENSYNIVGVVHRFHSRDKLLEEFAHSLNLSVLRYKNVNSKEFLKLVKDLEPDLNISMSFDQIIKRNLLESAPLGFINCHTGQLPYYRGRNVINWAIINNEKTIGLTIHYMDEGIDTGDIILQKELPIYFEDTYGDVLERVTQAYPKLLLTAVRQVEAGAVHRKQQSHLEGTYFSIRTEGDELIDWNDTSLNIYNFIRAIAKPGPGACTYVDGKKLIIWKARLLDAPKYKATTGEVVGRLKGQGVKVKTGDSVILVEKVQFEGEPEEAVADFKIGTRFGINLIKELFYLKNNRIKELESAQRG